MKEAEEGVESAAVDEEATDTEAAAAELRSQGFGGEGVAIC